MFNTAERETLMEKAPLWGAKILAAFFALGANFPPVLAWLLAMMFLDYVSGMSAAGARGRLSSEIAKKGLFRKLAVLAACCGGYVMSEAIPPQLGINLGSAICGGFIVAEFISILENVGVAGVKLPGRLQEILEKLKKEVGEEEDRKRVIRRKAEEAEKVTRS